MTGPTIPFLDLAAPYRELREDMDRAMLGVCERGWFLLGDELSAFEREFAEYVGARHCIGVANGLDALALSLRAMGIGEGDEVLVPTHTFVATWLAVTQVGAVPVGVEPDPRTYNLDPARLEAAITPRTRAIIPVHLYGQAADMAGITAVARAHGLRVLEDAAQAHGASFCGRRAGTLGDAAAWSFYPGKNLGAFGDGGAVTTDDDALAASLRKWRNYGASVKYVHDVPGYNSRLDDIQAAILRVKLRALDEWNARRDAIARRYTDAFRGLSIAVPELHPDATHSWHLYVVRHPRRDELAARLAERGVQTIIHYPIAPPAQPAYASAAIEPASYAIAAGIAAEVLSLPIGPHMTDAQVSHVIDAVTAAAQELQ